MRRFAGIAALLCTAILLFSFAGCGLGGAGSGTGQKNVAAITARRRTETAALTTLADEKDNLPFFSDTKQTAPETSVATDDATEAAQTASAAHSETAQPVQPTATGYVCNTSSKKFHLPTCGSVKTISDKNREDYSGSREDLIAKGYSPCKKCNP